MNTRPDDVLFNLLVTICAEINKQIPLAPNRFEEYECFAIDPAISDAERERLIKEAQKHAFQHQNEFTEALITDQIYKELHSLLDVFLRENQVASPLALSEQQKSLFKARLPMQAEAIFHQIRRQHDYLPEIYFPDISHVKDFLDKNIAMLAETLLSGRRLILENKDYAQRIELYDRLGEMRKSYESQKLANQIGLSLIGPDTITDLTKTIILWRGLFLQKTNASVGFCDEHATLALVMTQQILLETHSTPDHVDIRNILIEKIVIHDITEDGKARDAHTFLVINREPGSQLNDMSSWGNKAIILDPWNRLVCYASEYKKLSTCYISFSPSGKWFSEATYDCDDLYHARLITELDQKYALTGNSKLQDRIPRLMEEFELISLETPGYQKTKEYLYGLARLTRPANYELHAEIFLTTNSDAPVKIIPGFSEPKIAIHTSFIDFTEEELKFGLAQAQVAIQRNWAGMTSIVSAEDQAETDKRALEITKNGIAAIGYLRKAISMDENQDHQFRWQGLKAMTQSVIASTNESRIKLLMTLFALDNYAYLWNDEKLKCTTTVSAAIVEELKAIQRFMFFKDSFDCFKGTVNKIRYLIACLPELHTELFPYELHDPSIRLRHFCTLLRSLRIDLKRKKHLDLVNELIHAAWEAQIPGFAEIYCAVQGVHYRQYRQYNPFHDPLEPSPLRPLGIFVDLQSAVTRFVEADTMESVLTAASEIKLLHSSVAEHFDGRYELSWTKLYKQKYGHYPTGKERYFGSKLGKFIAWRAFVAHDKNNLPWVKHVSFAHQDATSVIADTLWLLGINAYKPLWSAFKQNDLLKRITRISDYPVFINVQGLSGYSKDQPQDSFLHHAIEAYIASNHQLQTDMFESTDLKEAIKLFCEVNWPMLANPAHNPKTANNNAVQFLLGKFAEIAQSGTSAEKDTVKQFFFGPEDQTSLKYLVRYAGRWSGQLSYLVDELYLESPYIRFMLDQQFNGVAFKLFQPAEIIEYFLKEIKENENYLYLAGVPLAKYMELYQLPYTEISLECMEALLPLMHKTKFGYSTECFSIYLSTHQPLAFSSEALRFIRLLSFCFEGISYRISSDHISWKIPDASDYPSPPTINDLIFLYRYYDSNFIFPSTQVKRQASKFIQVLISSINNIDDKIAALEALLLQKEVEFPLSDMSLRNDAIDMWVAAILQKYGKDDDSVEYLAQLQPVINRILMHISRRDSLVLFGRFAKAIESQWKISEYLGEQLEEDQFFLRKDKDKKNMLAQLAAFSKYFNESEEDQHKFLNFLSEPLTLESLKEFTSYILNNKDANSMLYQLDPTSNYASNREASLPHLLQTFYDMFWDRTLEQRAVIIDHVLIPAEKVKTDDDIRTAYQKGFDYVAGKLLPNADDDTSDDNVAKSVLKAYLDTADPYTRTILLAGMLVASNECASSKQTISVGKKIALMCEHMGPAYIKLAQAIHSHPSTPEHLRLDLDHIKGKANPLYRWQLWRLIQETIPGAIRARIKRVGTLLGSASYNLGLELKFDDQNIVLSLLREHAARDANKGFRQLTGTVLACEHPRLASSKEALVSILHEAQVSSKLEMDKEASIEQCAFAAKSYTGIIKTVSTPLRTYQIHFKPATLLLAGEGWRLLARVYGGEFNDLPTNSPHDRHVRRAIATAVIEVELINMLSGGLFDCDRHGSQYRADIDARTGMVTLGLYDFGEVSLVRPSRFEITQLAGIFAQIPERIWHEINLDKTMRAIIYNDKNWVIPIIETLLSERIEQATKLHEPTMYLMRLRKAFLALHDFHKELSAKQMIDILERVVENPAVHPELATAIRACLTNDIFSVAISQIKRRIGSLLDSVSEKIQGFFSTSVIYVEGPLIDEKPQASEGKVLCVRR